jgi:putative DNA methylase
MNYPKRLIEVDLPIKQISAHARREKSIRHGHISTLHIWWARRPLAACRAVICAALWPDPADPLCPAVFRERAAELITDFAEQAVTNKELANSCAPDTWGKWQFLAKAENQLDPANEAHLNVLRFALLDFIADFANWDNSTNAAYLATSRALTQAAHEALGGEPGTRPLVVDPFAGGGAIPLEALRVGADAFASDLNPVAVLLNKVVLEYIPKYGQQLADEVRKWGAWVKQEAEKELAEFYPKDPDGATPIAYLWARTIQCEGPGCGAEVPLMRSLWLSKKATRSTALRIVPNREAKRVDFEIIERKGREWAAIENPKSKIESPKFDGTVQRGSATCPCCGYTTPVAHVREQLKPRYGGTNDARLLCVVTTRENASGRFYRIPTIKDSNAIENAMQELERRKKTHVGALSLIPDEIIPPTEIRRISVPLYGMIRWGDFFSTRQALSLTTLLHQVKKLRISTDSELAMAVRICLALAIGKQADRDCSLCRWIPQNENIGYTFGRQAIGMLWDFVEAPWLSSGGGWAGIIDDMAATISNQAVNTISGHVEQSSVTTHPLPNDVAQAVITDPPYYDSVPYAHLSDFFYVWLRRVLSETVPDLFRYQEVPKEAEIVVDRPHRLSNSIHDIAFYERELTKAFGESRRVAQPNGIGTIVFASKSTSSWEAILKAVIDSGWIITGSWPVDTERDARMNAFETASLASSVHLVCRPRENPDGSLQADNIGDYRDVLHELPLRIREWMPRLAAEGVVGADAIFACLGPALEIFSRYARVEKVSGEQVLLREYLEQVWAAVSKEALNMIFAGADATGFDADARLTAMWFWTLNTKDDGGGMRDESESDDTGESDEDDGSSTKAAKAQGYTLEFDAARKIAQGLGAHLEDLDAVIEIKGDKARLLSVAERAQHLFGKQDLDAAPTRKKKTPQVELFDLQTLPSDEDSGAGVKVQAGGTVLDRVHQAMLLFSAGRSEALKRFLVEDGIGRDQRFWRLADALSKLYPMSSDEKRWVDGVLARKKGLGF